MLKSCNMLFWRLPGCDPDFCTKGRPSRKRLTITYLWTIYEDYLPVCTKVESLFGTTRCAPVCSLFNSSLSIYLDTLWLELCRALKNLHQIKHEEKFASATFSGDIFRFAMSNFSPFMCSYKPQLSQDLHFSSESSSLPL